VELMWRLDDFEIGLALHRPPLSNWVAPALTEATSRRAGAP